MESLPWAWLHTNIDNRGRRSKHTDTIPHTLRSTTASRSSNASETKQLGMLEKSTGTPPAHTTCVHNLPKLPKTAPSARLATLQRHRGPIED
jgi:hypothetical protein